MSEGLEWKPITNNAEIKEKSSFLYWSGSIHNSINFHSLQSNKNKKNFIFFWFHGIHLIEFHGIEWKYIITVILNEDWTYKDNCWNGMRTFVFIGEGRIKRPKKTNQQSIQFFSLEWEELIDLVCFLCGAAQAYAEWKNYENWWSEMESID